MLTLKRSANRLRLSEGRSLPQPVREPAPPKNQQGADGAGAEARPNRRRKMNANGDSPREASSRSKGSGRAAKGVLVDTDPAALIIRSEGIIPRIDVGPQSVARNAVELLGPEDILGRHALRRLDHFPDCGLTAAEIARELRLRTRFVVAGHEGFKRRKFCVHDHRLQLKL